MVRMLTDTCYNGKSYKVDTKYNIDSATEKRWIKNGIAVKVGGNAPPVFSDMTDEQLIEYAAQKGVDISRLTSRKGVIAKLEKAEGAE